MLALFSLLGASWAHFSRLAALVGGKHRKKCENRDFGPPKTIPKPFQNEVRTMKKSAALLAAPGVLNTIAFFACINILHFLSRGGLHGVIDRVFGLHVGAMLASLSLLGASWAYFSRLAARVGAVGRFSCVLECSGHDFGTSWAVFSWFLKRPWPHFSKFFCTTCVMAQVR